MSGVLGWIKTNIISVIFIVLMVGALVALPLAAKWMNGGVQEGVSERVSRYKELEKLEKTNVTIEAPAGGEATAGSVLVNEKLLRRFEEVSQQQSADAERVRALALAHNRKDRGVILPALFPEPPPAQREVLPKAFHGRLVEAYESLLNEINAGGPPKTADVSEDLARQKAQFMSTILAKDEEESLDDEETAQLQERLTRHRMSLYAAQAERLGLYVEQDDLTIPVWNQTVQPDPLEIFDWQWQYWIIEDILLALSEANGDASVQLAPVKRVLSLAVYDDAYAGAPSGGGGAFGRGGRDQDATPAGQKANPAQEVKLDFATLTGRMSNSLYDVRLVELRVVADTTRLPELFDALARRNFITILDIEVRPADPFTAARAGYFYGAQPVSEVTLTLETVWLREWTSPFMPSLVKQTLGVPEEKAGPPSSG